MNDVISDIYDGKFDKDLDRLVVAINHRRECLTSDKLMEFSIGDKVRFNHSTRPKYLIGEHATVVQKLRKKVKVKLDHPSGRFGSGPITCPLSLIDAV
jgi:hypothetical protein